VEVFEIIVEIIVQQNIQPKTMIDSPHNDEGKRPNVALNKGKFITLKNCQTQPHKNINMNNFMEYCFKQLHITISSIVWQQGA
jgi:hypothetical protein